MIHSIDSPFVWQRQSSEEAAKHGRVIPVLVEVNMAGEETKFGIRAGGDGRLYQGDPSASAEYSGKRADDHCSLYRECRR